MCIYVYMISLICMYMYVHGHVCTMYRHVHESIYLYVHGTYTFMNVNICVYTIQTRLYSFTTILHFPSGQISLAMPASLSSVQEQLLLNSLLPVISLLTDTPPRRGLPQPNCHCHWSTSYTFLPRRPSAAAVSQLPTGKPDLVCWLYY